MSRGGRSWAATLALAGALAAPRAPLAQLSATLDVGFSRVEYDGFLPSGAVSLTPAARFDRRSWSLTASGTFLRFESGNRSLQGLIAGSAFTQQSGRLRGEIGATAGASSYRQFPSFSHLLGRARLHFLSVDRGGWIAASAGQTALGASARPVTVYAAGAWTRRFPVTVDLSVAHTRVGDTAFTDFEAAGRWTRGVVELAAWVGTRGWSRGGGQGLYGEGTASVPLLERLALVLGAGRYPTDPPRGSVAGRYLSAGLRATGLTVPPRARIRTSTQLFRRSDASGESAMLGTDGHLTAAALEVRSGCSAACVVVIRAAWAQTVEIMGDFTDWQPIPLTRKRGGVWEVKLAIPPGIHRLNVRLDGGDWTVPRGATFTEDEFGGRVGTVVVP